MAEQIIPEFHYRLRLLKRDTGITVCLDRKWPGMWRIHTSSGKISDMVNLSRAKDAALDHLRHHGAINVSRDARWDMIRTAADADSEGSGLPDVPEGT